METRANHYSVTVSDVDAVVEFYQDLFDLELERHGTLEQGSDRAETFSALAGLEDVEVKSALLGMPGCNVELVQYNHPEGGDLGHVEPNDRGATHYCFSVDRDLREFYDEHEDDVDFVSPPVTFDGERYVVYFRDPEGNLLELSEPRE